MLNAQFSMFNGGAFRTYQMMGEFLANKIDCFIFSNATRRKAMSIRSLLKIEH